MLPGVTPYQYVPSSKRAALIAMAAIVVRFTYVNNVDAITGLIDFSQPELPESYMAQRDAYQRHSPDVVLLHDAVQQHDHAVVRDLLHSGADVHEAAESTGATALHHAAQRGDFEIVHELLLAGADPNRPRYDGETAVHLAVSSTAASLIPLLVDHGADVNVKADRGETPLHYAAQHVDLKMVEELLVHGARPDAVTEVNQTAADYVRAETAAEHRAKSAQQYHDAAVAAEESRRGILAVLQRYTTDHQDAQSQELR